MLWASKTNYRLAFILMVKCIFQHARNADTNRVIWEIMWHVKNAEMALCRSPGKKRRQMNKFIWALIFTVALGCAGCASQMTKITTPDKMYTLETAANALASFKDENVDMVYDGRGRPGLIEQWMSALFIGIGADKGD